MQDDLVSVMNTLMLNDLPETDDGAKRPCPITTLLPGIISEARHGNLPCSIECVLNHLAVSRLEYVERCDALGQQDRLRQREERHRKIEIDPDRVSHHTEV